MRGEYLFELAHDCNCPPPMVDALRYLDFISLILNIDALREARKSKPGSGG